MGVAPLTAGGATGWSKNAQEEEERAEIRCEYAGLCNRNELRCPGEARELSRLKTCQSVSASAGTGMEGNECLCSLWSGQER